MLLELIVELIGFVGEIAFECLLDFVFDFVPDWLTRREQQQK